jgi:hypothetical protein
VQGALVAIARSAGGASFLSALAAIATPVLAALCGLARGWRSPWWTAAGAAPLYVLAWLSPSSLAGEAAATLLIAAACLTVTALVAAVAPRRWLQSGLILLVVLDVILVWGDRQVAPAMNSLQAAATPSLAGHPLPALQQVRLGSTEMGWLDLAAPALLGLVVARRMRAALATGAAAIAWSALLLVTSPIAATPPVLAGSAAGRSPSRHARRSRSRAPYQCAQAPPWKKQHGVRDEDHDPCNDRQRSRRQP